jgi:hypothetical protein
MLAGMVLLPLLGVGLAVLGGRGKEALIGGICGLAVGAALGTRGGGTDIFMTSRVSLLVGGMVGATFPPLLSMLRARLATSSHPRP